MGKMLNEDHPTGKNTARHCRDTTEYDKPAAAHPEIRLLHMQWKWKAYCNHFIQAGEPYFEGNASQ
jgi:hypothetical protein